MKRKTSVKHVTTEADNKKFRFEEFLVAFAMSAGGEGRTELHSTLGKNYIRGHHVETKGATYRNDQALRTEFG